MRHVFVPGPIGISQGSAQLVLLNYATYYVDGIYNQMKNGAVIGMNNYVNRVWSFKGDLYFCGQFTAAGGVSATYIAKWDGDEWSNVGNANNTVFHFASDANYLYAVGAFTTIGGVSATRIARYDGTSWSALGSGLSDTGLGVHSDGSSVFAVGNFSSVQKFDGTSWASIGDFGFGGAANAVRKYGSTLYIGGNFSSIASVSAANVAQWDGTNWTQTGTGLNNAVYSIATDDTNLYYGGLFTMDGSSTVSLNRVAKNTGGSWFALGSGASNGSNGIVIDVYYDLVAEVLYIGGSFTVAGGVSSPYIAKWDGDEWSSLNYVLNNTVQGIVASGGKLYLGGFFTNYQ